MSVSNSAGYGYRNFDELARACNYSAATRPRRAGAGLDVVADVHGHGTLTMARRYAHLGAENIRAAMDTLPVHVVAFWLNHLGLAQSLAVRQIARDSNLFEIELGAFVEYDLPAQARRSKLPISVSSRQNSRDSFLGIMGGLLGRHRPLRSRSRR